MIIFGKIKARNCDRGLSFNISLQSFFVAIRMGKYLRCVSAWRTYENLNA